MSEGTPKGILRAGDVELVEVTMTLANGGKIDIKKCFSSLKIFEDIYANVLKVTISIVDSVDMISNGPIVGEEIVQIKMRTPGLDKKYDVDYTAVVYSITDRIQVNDKTQTYNINLISPEFIVSENKKISKYFKGEVGEQIKNILIDPNMIGSKREHHIDLTGSNIDFASPYWSPFKIINWLAQRTFSKKDNIPDYLFYETLINGFNFNSVSFLINEPVARDFIKCGAQTTDINQAYSMIQELYVDSITDYLKRAQEGTFASRLLIANPSTKNLKMLSLDSKEYFTKTPHLNQFEMRNPKGTTSKNAMVLSYIDQEFSFDGQRNLRFEEWLMQRNQLFGRLNNTFKVDFVVPGKFDIRVGQTCNINIEKTEQIGERDRKEYINPHLSGKYLIVSVCHVIGADKKHKMTIQAVTDSVSKEIK